MAQTAPVEQQHQVTSIYVGDLSPDVNERVLFDIFKEIGTVQFIKVCRDEITKQSLGYAYVNYVDPKDAERAIEVMNNQEIKGVPCRVSRVQRDPTDRKSGKGNIFVGNLDEQITNKELYDTFQQIGKITSCKVVVDRNSGKSLGYGYVHFEDEDDAETAIRLINGKQMLNKVVRVSKFIPRNQREAYKSSHWTNVYIKEIPETFSDDDLSKLFSQYGPITSCVIMRDNEGKSRGFGFANFNKHDDAKTAVEDLHGKIVEERTLYCARAQKKAERVAALKRDFEQRRRERINKYQGLNLYVKNLEDHITEDKLREVFEQFGTITSLKIMTDSNGTSKGFGFVCYSSQEEAQRAIEEMSRNRILPDCTKPLYVRQHEPKELRAQRFRDNRHAKPGMIGGPNVFSMVYPYAPYGQMPPVRRPWAPQFPANYAGQKPGVRNPVPPQAQPPVQTHAPMGQNVDITLEDLNKMNTAERHKALGDRIFSKVRDLVDMAYCGKITGMFLQSGWSVNELYDLLRNENKLRECVNEAMSAIKEQEQKTQKQ